MTKIKGYLWCVAIMLCAGCSTTPVTQSTAQSVPADRVYITKYLQQSPDRSASILISRDKGFSGSACSSDIIIDSEKVMTLRPSEAATLYVATGPHFLRLETGGGLCGNISASHNLVLGAGEQQVYRVRVPGGGGTLQLTRDK